MRRNKKQNFIYTPKESVAFTALNLTQLKTD